MVLSAGPGPFLWFYMPGQSHKSSSRDRAKKALRQMITTRDFWHQKCVSCLFCFGFLSKFLRKKKSAARVFFFPGNFSSKFLTRTRNSLFRISKTLDYYLIWRNLFTWFNCAYVSSFSTPKMNFIWRNCWSTAADCVVLKYNLQNSIIFLIF